jgi:hypothetical protein
MRSTVRILRFQAGEDVNLLREAAVFALSQLL